MKEHVAAKLTAKDDRAACAFADRMIAESRETDAWYAYFDDVAPLLGHPKSLVRNRAMHILAANAQWDEENRFDAVIADFLADITYYGRCGQKCKPRYNICVYYISRSTSRKSCPPCAAPICPHTGTACAR